METKNNQGWVTPLLLFCLLALSVFTNFFHGVSPPKWEYKIEAIPDPSFTELMNSLGKEGWEAVSARRATSGEKDADGTPKMSYEIIFKRPAP